MSETVASVKGDLGDFAPKGETKKLAGAKGGGAEAGIDSSYKGADRYSDCSRMVRGGPDSADRALDEFGGGLKTHKSSSLEADESIEVPKEGQESLVNRKI